MSTKEQEFRKRLLATFKVEAAEHLKTVSAGLFELEKMPAAERQAELIEDTFRSVHSLKGSARATNFAEIEGICHALESVFAALKRQGLTLSPPLFDLLHRSVDGLGTILTSIETEGTAADASRRDALVRQLEGVLKGTPPASPTESLAAALPSNPEREPNLAEPIRSVAKTIRVSPAKLDSLLLQIEELLLGKQFAAQHATQAQTIKDTLASWRKEWAKVRPVSRTFQRNSERDSPGHWLFSLSNVNGQIDRDLARLLDFLDWNDAFHRSLENSVTDLAKSAVQHQRSLSVMVDNALEEMKDVLILPFASALELFPKLVRDLSRDRGKEVELVIQGAEIMADRRILEELKDPLIHIVRNSIDHGIEARRDRELKKKSARGRIAITISQRDSRKVEVVVADDGAGIDSAKVRAAAVKLGVVSPSEAEKLSDTETLSLVFRSGVSTSPIVTEISGRGLGLAIVWENIERLGGMVSLESHHDAGTIFRILLPLTLATFRGVIVRVEDHLYVLPTANVERVLRVNRSEIKTVENRETIQFDGQVLALAHLSDALELNARIAPSDPIAMVALVIVRRADQRMALQVDQVLHEQEVLVKSLGPQLERVRNVSGATVLGNGRIVPILNIPDLLASAVQSTVAATREQPASSAGPEPKKSILVAEDSITSRTLLKSILETAGYEVATAVDGLDALTKLRETQFDLVVSDVEMPRMNGLDLTARIRADKKLAELPVVLVTALESREDRERGIDVGATAYIIKSSFDQSNLLEVLRRLI